MASVIETVIKEYKAKSEGEVKNDVLIQIAIASLRAGQLFGEHAQKTLLGMLVVYIKLAVEADGRFVEQERDLVELISKPLASEIETERFVAMCSGEIDASEYEVLAKTSELDPILGDAFARIMMCFMAVDGEVCAAEEKEFRNLFRCFADKLESYVALGGSDLYMALVSD